MFTLGWSLLESWGLYFSSPLSYLLADSGGELDASRDSVVCLGNIQHPKLTRYGTYKLQKLHTARPTAPATSPASEANPIDARTPSSTATAARGVAHGIVRACARTTGLLRAASACDVAIAHSNPASVAK